MGLEEVIEMGEQARQPTPFEVASVQDIKGLGPGVCAGCGGTGPSLLIDSVGHWCEDCGGFGIAVRRGEVA